MPSLEDILYSQQYLGRKGQPFNPGTGGGGITTAVIDLDSEQIANLGSSPIEFVPGQANTILSVINVVEQVTDGSIPFSSNAFCDIAYTNDLTAISILNTALAFSSNALGVNGSNAFYSPGIYGNTLSTDGAGVVGSGLSSVNGGDDPSGALTDAGTVINAGGTGYAPLDTFTVNGSAIGVPFEAAGVVDTVDGGGGVLTYHFTAAGAGYSTGTGVTTTSGGGGTGFTIDISTVTPANGTARIWITYLTLSVL